VVSGPAGSDDTGLAPETSELVFDQTTFGQLNTQVRKPKTVPVMADFT
jgi:hypothetical protein